jgi:hypothetical protein
MSIQNERRDSSHLSIDFSDQISCYIKLKLKFQHRLFAVLVYTRMDSDKF